jgi:hypothetical protein
MYKIDKNVPIKPKGSGGKSCKYPFDAMEVGDSFFLLKKNEALRARSAAANYGREHNRKFTVRIFKDGYRCWRTK